MRISVTATPTAPSDPIRVVRVQLSGAFTYADSLTATGSGSVTLSDVISVPAVRGAVTVTGSTTTRSGAVGSGETRLTVQDTVRPTVFASLGGGRVGAVYSPGDTVQLTLTSGDNVGLGYVGYTIAAPVGQAGSSALRDSAAVSGTSAQHVFTAVVPTAWAGSVATVSLFAIDGAGNRLDTPGGALSVLSAGVRGVALAGVRDLAYDAKRHRVYASLPAAGTVAVVDVSSGALTILPAYTLPGAPRGLDLSVGGDSLVIGLRSTQLGIVNLVSVAVDAVTVLTNTILGRVTDNVRVAANNRAVFTATFDGSGYGGAVLQYDLAAKALVGSETPAFGAGGAGLLATETVPLAASGDRTRVFGLVDDSCCAEDGFVYNAATGLFPIRMGTVSMYGPSVATTRTGDRFLIGKSLFTSD